MVSLDRLLTALDVHIDAFTICEVCRGWRLAFGPDETATAHYVLSGSGVLQIEGNVSIPLSRDTFVVLPPRTAHAFEAVGGFSYEARGKPLSESQGQEIPRVRAGDGTSDSCMVVACGAIRTTHSGGIDFFLGLRAPISGSFKEKDSLRGIFEGLLAEVTTPRIGTRALTEALLKQCLILLLRRQSNTQWAAPWLEALGDPRLARAIAVMVKNPVELFTLADLARIAGMSRSTFVKHFSSALGKTPIGFLRDLRLDRSVRLLETTDLSIEAVAKAVGYASRSYFSRAFKARYGFDPTTFRANVTAPENSDLAQSLGATVSPQPL